MYTTRHTTNKNLLRPQKLNEIKKRITERKAENLGVIRATRGYRPLPR